MNCAVHMWVDVYRMTPLSDVRTSFYHQCGKGLQQQNVCTFFTQFENVFTNISFNLRSFLFQTHLPFAFAIISAKHLNCFLNRYFCFTFCACWMTSSQKFENILRSIAFVLKASLLLRQTLLPFKITYISSK